MLKILWGTTDFSLKYGYKAIYYIKLNTILFLGFLGLILSPAIFAQMVNYTYDAAGNRISRTLVVGLKSTGVEEVSFFNEETQEFSDEQEENFSEQLGSLQVTLFPIPTKGELVVRLTGLEGIEEFALGTLEVYNLNGQLLITKKM